MPVGEIDPFSQQTPALTNRWPRDESLRLAVRRLVTETADGDQADAAAVLLDDVGRVGVDELAPLAAIAEANPPRHRPYDAWGNRVDTIDVEPAWRQLVARSQELGMVALPYERPFGAASRVVQAAALQLLDPLTATAMCPLSMTDACAALLLRTDPELAASWVPALTARTGGWTAGQWMTEKEGGSDVGRTGTVAVDAGDGTFLLRGTKFFTSATTADVAVALARPEGAEEGSRGLSLFALKLRASDGGWNGLRVRRLKDKLGTHALPTSELDLLETVAVPVGGLGRGVPKVAAVLQVARLWAAQSGPGATGHLLALARSYAGVRQVAGGLLAESPLHRAWLADLAASYEAMLQLSLRAAQLVGMDESGADRAVSPLARVVLPLTKMACSRQGFDAVSQLVESFGGPGYCEDSGIPQVLRDVLVHCIWEGTGNVLALDVVRALRDPDVGAAWFDDVETQLGSRPGPVAARAEEAVRGALPELARMVKAADNGTARDLAWSMARTYQLALVVAHARWAFAAEGALRPGVAADVLATRPLITSAISSTEELASLALG